MHTVPASVVPATLYTSVLSRVEAWRLTAAMSPRPRARVAVRDAYGEVLNSYPALASLDAEAPELPWAVHLTDVECRFLLLAFDLDGKTPAAAAQAETDAALLVELLAEARMEPVVCASGGGGRHVWVALAQGVAADVVASLARLVQYLCPSLDVTPLANPITGCVRPPGAPHRHGQASAVMAGDVASLVAPTATAAHVERLLELAADRVQQASRAAVESAPVTPARGLLPVDDAGRLYLPGPQRGLSASAQAALGDQPAAGADTSGVLWTVLLGTVAARWRCRDVEGLLGTAAGLEHARTERVGAGRRPRGRAAALAVLRRQWDKAVRHVAAHTVQGTDPDFAGRAGEISSTVRLLQSRADAAAGRWRTGGGATDRRVLDALCVLALQAVRTAVEADVRRLGEMCGISHETARRALWRLSDDGWIGRTRPAEGIHAAHWTITPTGIFHSDVVIDVPQGNPPPAAAPTLQGPAERTALLARLQDRLADCAHDLFTPSPGLVTWLGMCTHAPVRLE